MIAFLLRVGLVRMEKDGSIRWPFHVSPRWQWKVLIFHEKWFAVFRNRSGFVKWTPGRLLPRRWGFRFLMVEFGDRG